MNIKTSALFLFIILFGFLNNAYASINKYINKADPSESIELHENKTFILSESGIKMKGKYSLAGTELVLNFKFKGKDYVVKALLENNIITDNNGKIWSKNFQIPPLLISTIAAIIAIIFLILSNKIANKYVRSLSQVASIFAGILFMFPFAESAIQARSVLGKYYFYILIVAAILNKIFTNKNKKNQQANK